MSDCEYRCSSPPPGLAIALLAPAAGYLLERFGRCRLLIAATVLYGFAGAVMVGGGDEFIVKAEGIEEGF